MSEGSASGYAPVPGHIMTRWAKEVTPETVWPEYPRPQLARPEWLNLNGLWDYTIAPIEIEMVQDFNEKILVPFPIESALSGVKRALEPGERLWYRRHFTLPKTWQEQRVLLHFGAVDWETYVWLNGQWLGRHQGGYLPFTFELTRYLQAGENELLLAVCDPTDTHWQQRGKQVRNPRSIWYTQVSGIWQTVWLEPVPETYISRLKITPDIDAQAVTVAITLNGPAVSGKVQVLDGGSLVCAANVVPPGIDAQPTIVTLPIPEPRLWSPDSPHIYDLTVSMGADHVESYFAMRKFSLAPDAQGRTRFCLNNQPLFLFGPLDQGYWPDGLYTPPTAAAMRFDLELIKGLGCNMLRKHIKVEPARYYYDCDRLGLIVWQDMPNGGLPVSETTSFLTIIFGSRRRDRNYRYTGRQAVESRQDYRRELAEMVDHLANFACIGVWVPFNEGWGQFEARATADWLKATDPTRLVDHASGWFDQGGGDFKSLHVYFKKLPRTQLKKGRALVLSEFGGYALKIPGHIWNPGAEFGYSKYPTVEALTRTYLDLLKDQLQPWLACGLSAAIYTQTTDVEIEVNGFVTYDREVEKMDFSRLRQAHHELTKDATGGEY